MLTGFNLIIVGRRAQDTLLSQMMWLLHLALMLSAHFSFLSRLSLPLCSGLLLAHLALVAKSLYSTCSAEKKH